MDTLKDKNKPLRLVKSPVYDVVDEVEPLYNCSPITENIVAPLIAKLKESFSVLKQCYDEAETTNYELEELLHQSLLREEQSLARERELIEIIRDIKEKFWE